MEEHELQTKLAKIIARAWAEPDFKAHLKNDPRNALKAMEVELSPEVNMTVIEDSSVPKDTATEWYLHLPPSPLTEGDGIVNLGLMAPGGSSSSGQCCKCMVPPD